MKISMSEGQSAALFGLIVKDGAEYWHQDNEQRPGRLMLSPAFIP